MIKAAQISVIIVLLSSFSQAQDSTKRYPFWLNFSAGGSKQFLNFSSSFNKSLEDYSYQISINTSRPDLFSKYFMTTGNFGIGLADFNKKWLLSSIFIGPSVSYGEGNSNSNNTVPFWGMGVSINAHAYFMPLYKLIPGVGLGVELFYNFNAIQTEDVNFRNVYSIRVGFTLTDLHMK